MVMGAGGMGALFGAILAAGGLEVVLVDSDQDHIDAINKNGLKIDGYGSNRVQDIKAVSHPGEIPSADIVLVQTKGTATRKAAESMRHLAGQAAKRFLSAFRTVWVMRRCWPIFWGRRMSWAV